MEKDRKASAHILSTEWFVLAFHEEMEGWKEEEEEREREGGGEDTKNTIQDSCCYLKRGPRSGQSLLVFESLPALLPSCFGLV